MNLLKQDQSGPPDMMDLIRDIIGCLVALSFWAPARKTISKARLRIWQAISVILVAMAFLPLIIAILDETTALKQFPVLSDFETRFRFHPVNFLVPSFY